MTAGHVDPKIVAGKLTTPAMHAWCWLPSGTLGSTAGLISSLEAARQLIGARGEDASWNARSGAVELLSTAVGYARRKPDETWTASRQGTQRRVQAGS